MTKTLTLLLTASCALASQPNAVILGDAYTFGGHADGGVFVEGNWYGHSYEPNNHALTTPGLYLKGDNLTTAFLRVNQGVGTLVGAIGSFQGSLVTTAEPDWGYYRSLSDSYAALPGVPVDLSAENNVHVFLTPGLNVFNVSATQFQGLKTLDFTGSTTGTVVFNVTGSLYHWGWSTNYAADKLVFNFLDASSVNIDSRSFTGSLLAPDAVVYQFQNITGLLVAGSWNNFESAELHGASLPVPEPSCMVLAVLAGLFLRNRPRNT